MKNINDRIVPSCKHFNQCGGCTLQDLDEKSYKHFKSSILENIILSLGVDISVLEPMINVGEHTRRRAEFKISVNKGDVKIGFFAAKTHDVVEIRECPVSENKLVEALPALKLCLQSFKKPGILKAFSLTILTSGLDAIIIARSKIKDADKEKLVTFAKENQIIRLSEQIGSDEPITFYNTDKANIRFSDIDVEIPSGAFLQATGIGEDSITNIVTEHLNGCNNVADLYSGCGTYSFPLIKQAKRVSSFEGSGRMIAAMHNAISHNNLDGCITASIRDLFKSPLKVSELNIFDGIVINPPRNGALPQTKTIGKSTVKKVVMISCNPSTFKRDAQCLLDSGYKMTKAVAIDQFLYSNHLEIAACFNK